MEVKIPMSATPEYKHDYNIKYRLKNSEYFHEYYTKNKEKVITSMMTEMVCECGFTTAKCNLKRHQKSKLHTKKLVNTLGNIKEIVN